MKNREPEKTKQKINDASNDCSHDEKCNSKLRIEHVLNLSKLDIPEEERKEIAEDISSIMCLISKLRDVSEQGNLSEQGNFLEQRDVLGHKNIHKINDIEKEQQDISCESTSVNQLRADCVKKNGNIKVDGYYHVPSWLLEE